MFTGLIQDIGEIIKIEKNNAGLQLIIQSELAEKIRVNDSVAVNGVCQTAIDITENKFTVQAIGTTLEKTNFYSFKEGEKVNLELALTPIDRIGGHFVQGHVNCVTEVINIEFLDGWKIIWINMPSNIKQYLILEGSICLDGISLTISHLNTDRGIFAVSLIPHTLEKTTAKNWKSGTVINIEVDVLSKYVENLLFHTMKRSNHGLI